MNLSSFFLYCAYAFAGLGAIACFAPQIGPATGFGVVAIAFVGLAGK